MIVHAIFFSTFLNKISEIWVYKHSKTMTASFPFICGKKRKIVRKWITFCERKFEWLFCCSKLTKRMKRTSRSLYVWNWDKSYPVYIVSTLYSIVYMYVNWICNFKKLFRSTFSFWSVWSTYIMYIGIHCQYCLSSHAGKGFFCTFYVRISIIRIKVHQNRYVYLYFMSVTVV